VASSAEAESESDSATARGMVDDARVDAVVAFGVDIKVTSDTSCEASGDVEVDSASD
jgi:hypothetical protein